MPKRAGILIHADRLSWGGGGSVTKCALRVPW